MECILEALEVTMSSNNGNLLDRNFTQISGATIEDPDLASVTYIFGAIYIDRVVDEGNSQLHPSDWKRYRDEGWDIEEECDEIKFMNLQSILTLFRLLPGCAKMAFSRLMKLSDF